MPIQTGPMGPPGACVMTELRLRQEPLSPWPVTRVALVGVGVAVALVWATVAPPSTERLPAAATALALVVLLAAAGVGAVSLYAAPRRLAYRLRGRTLELQTLTGTLRVPAASLRGAERIDFVLRLTWGTRLGWSYSHLPGYYVGLFRIVGAERVRGFAGARRGSGVLLRPARGDPLLLTPVDAEALLAWVARYGGA